MKIIVRINDDNPNDSIKIINAANFERNQNVQYVCDEIKMKKNE